MSRDANDLLREEGPDGLRHRFDAGAPGRGAGAGTLEVGSDQEVAGHVANDLRAAFGAAVFAEGAFHVWSGRAWRSLAGAELHRFISAYDGRIYRGPDGKDRRFKVNKSIAQSVAYCLAQDLAAEDFFAGAPAGLNTRSGFLQVGDDGSIRSRAHAPDQRQRHVLDANWHGDTLAHPPPGSALHKLVTGCFRYDPEADAKAALLSEILGVAAFGQATRLPSPRAIIFLGETAGNGKSQWLGLLKAVLPPGAVSAITPAELGQAQRRVQLAGKLLNASDELGEAAVRSDSFKAVITGDRVSGKTVFKEPVEFCPCALHVFATNRLPPFSDGMDRGVRRRLLIVPFERTIPPEEQIAGLGAAVARDELDLLLAWAIDGFKRVCRQGGFTEPASGRAILSDWALASDPVAAFLTDPDVVEITGERSDRLTTKQVYRRFQVWAREEGLQSVRTPDHGQFTRRVSASAVPGVRVIRHGQRGREIVGLRLV